MLSHDAKVRSSVNPTGKRAAGKPQSSAAFMLTWIAIAELLGMSLWFAGTAAAPGLAHEFALGDREIAWLTMAVQVGFVAGTLASAFANLPDILPARHVFAAGCLIGAAATASAIPATSSFTLIAGRFVTGMALACVYPPAMKIAAAWTVHRRGTALGLLIGALTLGKAVPHLLAVFSSPLEWRGILLLVSGQAIAGAAIMLIIVRDGPHLVATARFDPRAVSEIVRNPRARSATLGYLGHMWELYAFWTWIGAFGAASAAANGDLRPWAPIAAFTALAVGAPACLGAGVLADRIGKARVARGAMLASGACALLSPFAFQAGVWVVFALTVIWGAAVIADSAQFSALIAEHSEPTHVGTALTLQVSLGFLLTIVTIRSTQVLASTSGWAWALAPLAIGPLVGALAMAPGRYTVTGGPPRTTPRWTPR
jgi:MFS family permease